MTWLRKEHNEGTGQFLVIVESTAKIDAQEFEVSPEIVSQMDAYISRQQQRVDREVGFWVKVMIHGNGVAIEEHINAEGDPYDAYRAVETMQTRYVLKKMLGEAWQKAKKDFSLFCVKELECTI